MTVNAPDTDPRWTIDGFAAFWAHPDISLVRAVMTDDIVGHWSGRDEPVRGADDYTACIAALLDALPDIRLEIGEHAETGDHTFVRWIMQATGRLGPFTITGIDRIHCRDGKVDENYVVFDTGSFTQRSGISVPWAPASPGRQHRPR